MLNVCMTGVCEVHRDSIGAYSLTLMGACAVLHVGRRRTLTICLTLFISGPFRQAVGVVHAFAICVYLLFRVEALEHNDAFTGSLN